eukprot:gene20890-27079_t
MALMHTLIIFIAITISGVAASSATGEYFVFAYSWTPEFCYGKTSSYPGCQAPQSYWGEYFTLHGLWPQYSSGGYPASCTTEAFNSSIPVAVGYDDMIKYWPNVQYAESDPQYDSFWEHEWTKHGTCTTLSQEEYFSAGLNLIKKFGTPASLTSAVGGTIAATDLRNALGGAAYVSLQCTSGKYLNGAYTCWSMVNGLPSAQIQCASDVQKEDTCTSSTISVASF